MPGERSKGVLNVPKGCPENVPRRCERSKRLLNVPRRCPGNVPKAGTRGFPGVGDTNSQPHCGLPRLVASLLLRRWETPGRPPLAGKGAPPAQPPSPARRFYVSVAATGKTRFLLGDLLTFNTRTFSALLSLSGHCPLQGDHMPTLSRTCPICF